MEKLKFIIISFHFMIVGCQVDPSPKKHPFVQKKTVNKSVTDSYNPSVDILFIVDNSGSMAGVQKLLSKNAQLFIDEFLETEFIDYHIAVTNSTVKSMPPAFGDGNLMVCKDLAEKSGYNYPNYIDRNTPRAGECLKEMMKVGTDSQTDEYFFNIPVLALSGPSFVKNFSFYRSDAHLAIFIITDSFDQSDVSFEEVYRFLLNLKGGDEKKIHYAAGIVTFAVRQYGCTPEEESPTSFIELAKLFGNRSYLFNLCQFNFGKDLAYFANHLVDSTLVIPLDYLPDMDTIEIRYDYKGGNQLIPNGFKGWSYDAIDNAVRLSKDIQLKKEDGKFNIKYEVFYTPEL